MRAEFIPTSGDKELREADGFNPILHATPDEVIKRITRKRPYAICPKCGIAGEEHFYKTKKVYLQYPCKKCRSKKKSK